MITFEFKAVKFKETYLPSAPVGSVSQSLQTSIQERLQKYPIYRNLQEVVGPDGCFVIKQKGPKADLTTSQRSCYNLPLPREQNVEKEDLDYCRSFIARQNVIPVVLGRQGYFLLEAADALKHALLGRGREGGGVSHYIVYVLQAYFLSTIW